MKIQLDTDQRRNQLDFEVKEKLREQLRETTGGGQESENTAGCGSATAAGGEVGRYTMPGRVL